MKIVINKCYGGFGLSIEALYYKYELNSHCRHICFHLVYPNFMTRRAETI